MSGSAIKQEKDLLFPGMYDTISERMEVGLFFMPKNRQPRKLPSNTLIKKHKARWKLCVQESHWNVQNASSVTTT